MPYRTITELREQVGASFPDNTDGEISAQALRDSFKNLIDTLAPGYGIMGEDSLTLTALGITPQVITYSSLLGVTTAFECDIMNGTTTRLAHGLPTTVNRVSFYADLSAPQGDEVVFSLFRDGADVPGGGTVSGQGLGNVVQVAFSVFSGAIDNLDHYYDIRALKITGGTDDVNLANVRFIVEYIPTLGI